jgi:hypothetical protein
MKKNTTMKDHHAGPRGVAAAAGLALALGTGGLATERRHSVGTSSGAPSASISSQPGRPCLSNSAPTEGRQRRF